MEHIESQHLVAGEVLTTGICPLDCAYCYIPKHESMKEMHAKIIEMLKSGEMFEDLETVYGKSLEYIGFWGTEPTLTMDILSEKLEDLAERFPKLKELNFSTSLMTDPMIIVRFVESLNPYRISLRFQISLDGPAWITDTNRVHGSADVMVENFSKLIQGLNAVELKDVKVSISWKATHSIDNIREFIREPKKVREYEDFFLSLAELFESQNAQENIILQKNSYLPTLVVPGKYTSQDGRDFAKYLKLISDEGFNTTYTWRLHRLFKYETEIFKRRQHSCSAGDSNLGIGENIHMCHRTFYYDNEEYINAIFADNEINNWDISLFERGALNRINKDFIVDPNNKVEMARFLYVMRGYHDFWKLQISYVKAITTELAAAGQADPIYLKDKKLLELFALFVNAALSCPMENLLNTGSIHLQTVSLLRMFANGAFQEIVKSAIFEIERGKKLERSKGD